MKFRQIALFILFQVPFCQTVICRIPISSEQDKIIAEITDSVKQKYTAHAPDSIIKALSEKALKQCGIDRDVIILQRESDSCSYTYSKASVHPQEYLIVSTKRNKDEGKALDEIESDIYHEIGHLAHGDMSWERKKSDLCFVWGCDCFSLLAAALAFKYIPFKSPVIRGILASGVVLSAFIGSAFGLHYKNSLQEARADEFAYKKLLEHGKLGIAVGQITDYLYSFNNEMQSRPPSPRYLTGYPTDFERAKIGIKVLQDAGYDIAELCNNLPEQADEGIKKAFPTIVKKYFPELFRS